MVVLHENPVRERTTVVDTAASAHRRLLQGAEAGRRLARVADPGPSAGGLDVAVGQRGDAGQVAEEVEGGALAGEHRSRRTSYMADRPASVEARAVGEGPLPVHVRGDLRKGPH